jgi:hypothetical protein
VFLRRSLIPSRVQFDRAMASDVRGPWFHGLALGPV